MSGRLLRWAGIGVAVATMVFAVVLASRFGKNPSLIDSPLIGKPAPEFELPALDGNGVTRLSDLKGNVVLVNFFASWCLQCRLEHDDLVATADAFYDKGVRMVLISYQEKPEDSLAWLDEVGTSPVQIYLQDPGSRTAIAYGVFGIPETFFINQEGIVVGKIIGESDAFVLGATIDAILRGETPGQQITGDTQRAPGS